MLFTGLSISQPVNDSLTYGRLQDSIDSSKGEGIYYARKGKLDKAKKIFFKELQYKKAAYDAYSPKLADTYVNLGVIFKEQGRLDEALNFYEQAENIYRQHPQLPYRKPATNYQNMANIFTNRQDYQKAITYYQQALDLFKKDSLQNLDRIGMVYNNLGIVFKNQNRLDSAIHYYQKSIALKAQRNKGRLFSTYGNMANLYRIQGNLEQADKYFRKTLRHGNQYFGSSSYLLTPHLSNFGLLHTKRQHYKEAEKLLTRVLRINMSNLGPVHPETAKAYENLGFLYSQRGDYTQALQYFQKALAALSESFHDTLTYHAHPAKEQVTFKPTFVNILKYKAEALISLEGNRINHLQTALQTYELALDVIKKLRMGYQSQESKLLLTSNERETFINTILTAVELYQLTGDPQYMKTAFLHAEESKAAVLYEAIQTNKALSLGNIPDSLTQRESRLKKQIWTYEELIYEEKRKRHPDNQKIEYWRSQFFRLNREYENLIGKIESNYPRYYALKYEHTPFKPATIQSELAKDEVILEYVHARDRIFAFVIEKDMFTLESISIDTNFTQRVLKLRSFLADRNFSSHNRKDFHTFIELANDLYGILIKPLNIGKNKSITIIPDDILSYIPFEILVGNSRKYDQISYHKLDYLIKDHKIGYSYSAKVLFNEVQKERDPAGKLAAFAPTYADNSEVSQSKIQETHQDYRENLYPLKGIKKEVDRITRIMGGDAYEDFKATERIFKLKSGNYDILHLAMHALVNDQEPMYSKMAFTQEPDQKEDGFLNTYEIYDLNLESRMAVLSSCNTGAGKLRKGEGVISLARGFKYAGCPAIVMTMWPVEDNSSIRLMEYFYHAISKGKSKDQALREAKLNFMDNSDPLHAHPYFWAGYILIGDKSELYKPLSFWWIITASGILIIFFLIMLARRKCLFGGCG